MTTPNLSDAIPPAPEVESDPSSPAQITAPPLAQPVLTEVEDIHRVLLHFARESHGQQTELTAREQREQLATRYWWGAVIALAALQLPIPNVWVALVIAVMALMLVLISTWIGGQSLLQEWRNRRIETLELLQGAAERERPLIQALCAFSRPALLHAAASARAADQRVSSRLAFVLGPNRAGGFLGALFLVFGIFSAGKYLQENKVQIPWFGTPITADSVLVAGATLLVVSFAVLLAGASVASVTNVADLLERVAALKKNINESEKPA